MHVRRWRRPEAQRPPRRRGALDEPRSTRSASVRRGASERPQARPARIPTLQCSMSTEGRSGRRRSTDKATGLSERRKYRNWKAKQKIEIVLAACAATAASVRSAASTRSRRPVLLRLAREAARGRPRGARREKTNGRASGATRSSGSKSRIRGTLQGVHEHLDFFDIGAARARLAPANHRLGGVTLAFRTRPRPPLAPRL